MSSLDGAFQLSLALKRLLLRCPALQSNPGLSALSHKVEDEVTANDVVVALAEPFLHPSYTIPIMGCFRPLNQRIVEHVAKLLRRVIPRLLEKEDTDTYSMEVDHDASEIEEDDPAGLVVEFYVRRGKKGLLMLHDLACLAFCRAIDLAPFVRGAIIEYFKYKCQVDSGLYGIPPPFHQFSIITDAVQFSKEDIYLLTRSIRVSYRYLFMEPEDFSKLWNWATVLDLVENPSHSRLCSLFISSNDTLDIKWCAEQILSVIFRMSDMATTRFVAEAAEALACSFRWDEFCQDTSLEKASWYFQTTEMHSRRYDNERTILHGNKFNRRDTMASSSHIYSDGNDFVMTSALQKSYELAFMAVSQKWPTLLYGPSGAGKTTLINMLAVAYGRKVLFIHMDDQMDSKTLIGSYICAEQPGQFRWQSGSLTQAVQKGFWLVFEDIDKAPTEVHSTLLPLLEGSNSFATGHGEAITVAETFCLFATISSSKLESFHGKSGFSALWRRVMVPPPSSKDMVEIMNKQYSCLNSYTSKLLETFEKANSISYNNFGGFQSSDANSCGDFSKFSLRHLLKFSKRVAALPCCFSSAPFSVSNCKSIYEEAVDIFASFSSSFHHRRIMMKEIAMIWSVPVVDCEHLYPPNKPTIKSSRLNLQVGRITIECLQGVAHLPSQNRQFADLRSSLHVLERIACCVKYNEPILLVGETGTGKTTLVQNLAMRLGKTLTVLNMSQQSDIADLLGGFKPTSARSLCVQIHQEFVELLCKTFSKQANGDPLRYCEKYVMNKKWKPLLSSLQKYVDSVLHLSIPKCGSKRKRHLAEIHQDWELFSARLNFAKNIICSSSCISFSFVEGAFVNALRNGHWILLDEINLAPAETLQRINGVLDGELGSICLAERGDVSHVERHPSFRVFACMNPATDAGKRDLSHSLRSRFTEHFVDEILDDDDLFLFVKQFMVGSCKCEDKLLHQIVNFYKVAKRESEVRLQDGANQKPQFSLRSLARALEYASYAGKRFNLERAIFDGFSMFFVTSLDGPSGKIMNNLIVNHLLGGKVPPAVPYTDYLIKKLPPVEDYIITESVKGHLKNIACAIYIKRYPVLLQGPTSSGKTSLVQYLASVTGHEFIRINNHDHTDLQEYFGSYITNSSGMLEFQEGSLVKAVRNGHWIVLDELNLAPSDVLEALNRLLDDNRELFVPELQERIPAAPGFMLFATQNPPTLYAGRKMLSRAFRNRFIEIHVDEIPESELSTILEKRCKIPKSYAMKMVDVLKDLQLHRQNSKVFAGKHGFITPRDLFRWANRFRRFGKSYEDLAQDGYFVLAERLREDSERRVVQKVLECRLRVSDVLKRSLNLYNQISTPSSEGKLIDGSGEPINITWTASMQRLYFLVRHCYSLHEPVLLVGETGGGKTTVCQFLSAALQLKLHTLNCHQYTESSDFLGGFNPVLDRSRLTTEYKDQIDLLKLSKIFHHLPNIPLDIASGSSTLDHLKKILNRHKKDPTKFPDVTKHDLHELDDIKLKLTNLQQEWQTLFLWQDGPLVQAMKEGHLFLVDEISLADDSVLERLNSVLEPERTLSLAEKGGHTLEKIKAHPKFLILATMNPGGDYGKKELSPALRNRFTEIWVPPVTDPNELSDIAKKRFHTTELTHFVHPMLGFWKSFHQIQVGRVLTVRDLLSWIDFMNVTAENLGCSDAFIHGAFLVLLDGLSLGTGMSKDDAVKLRLKCFSELLEQLKVKDISVCSELENYGWGNVGNNSETCSYDDVPSNLFGIRPFFIKKGPVDTKQEGFEFLAPTTSRNALRLLRAMQLPKPVLLEGSPGVGKTSLVVALARYSGHNVVRINLSEQTDMMDLIGSHLPINSDDKIEFGWSDGILLQAIKEGSWVLLDELNLAPQSVLEGLNAILDHRSEVYVPELGASFKCPPSFRIFACQNPSSQGGGRKGLPKSFLNRFTKVYGDELAADDYLFICRSLHPSIPIEILTKLITFNSRIYEDTMLHHKYGQVGSPWEFNLRDVIRSCQIIEGAPEKVKHESFLNAIYIKRMRTERDRLEVIKCYEEIFGVKLLLDRSPNVHISPKHLIIGSTSVMRNYFQPAKILTGNLNISAWIAHYLEAILHCINHQWLCLLVGPPSSGKTSIIRLLGNITGNSLRELNLSSSTDVSELLGCFGQYSGLETCKVLINRIEGYVYEYYTLRLHTKWESLINDRKHLLIRWFDFKKTLDFSSYVSSAGAMQCSQDFSSISLDPLVEVIEQLKLDFETHQLPVSWSKEELNKSLLTAKYLKNGNGMQKMAKFEWVPGDLIKSIECGEWIVLDNANLCNPTVLDRINSLVEPDGSITVNECGLVDGKPLVVHAHPNFRMFLTFDPIFGEVSRAMRNRGVEMFIEPNSLLKEDRSDDHRESIKNDVRKLLVYSGIPQCKLVDAMTEAHIYAKDSGSQHGIDITLLELTRWVQLFQQLLVSGNQPMWSLQLSWEHIYLSSLGEIAGKEIIPLVKSLHLSHQNWFEFGPLQCSSMAHAGGWPFPLNLRRSLWFSQETSIAQNCMYLEFLGAQCASYQLSKKPLSSIDIKKLKPSIIPVHFLYKHIFPMYPDQAISMNDGAQNFDLELTQKVLQIAANWTLEQATPNDLNLYRLWFEWCSYQLQPYCNFFNSFLSILNQVKDHSIWKFILDCWHQLTCHNNFDTYDHQLPLISFEVMDWAGSNGTMEQCKISLHRAVDCIGLLRASFQQWNMEMQFTSEKIKLHFSILNVLKRLRHLEEDVLDTVLQSPFFDMLIHVYPNIIDYHTVFWKSVTTFPYQEEKAAIAWYTLKKEVLKLQNILPNRVKSLLDESSKMQMNLAISKPFLWLYGGHPLLPSFEDLHDKLQQLLKLCNTIWPGTMKLWKQPSSDDQDYVVVALSTIPKLKKLVMTGICMSSFISIKDSSGILDCTQLEEIYQSLLSRFDHERSQLLILSKSENKNLFSSGNLSGGCCVLCPDILVNRTALSCWFATCLFPDWKSFYLDLEILHELSKVVLLSPHEIFKVLFNISNLLHYSLRYSLEFSSRSPTDFIPHQKILWLFDAWESFDSVHVTMANVIHEMWFEWHSSLWTSYSKPFKNYIPSFNPECFLLLQPLRTALVEQILQDCCSIMEYEGRCLKLRVTSQSFKEATPLGGKLLGILHSTARSLFQQILFVHRKSFENDDFQSLENYFSSLNENTPTEENLQSILALILSSTHERLTSLTGRVIVPLLRELFVECSAHDYIHNLGLGWIHIGVLRFLLLFNGEDLDPTLKYAFKHSNVLEKISSLELEIKVRKNCEKLSGRSLTRDTQKKIEDSIHDLDKKQRKLQQKIVFRNGLIDYSSLKWEIAEFLTFLGLEDENLNIPLTVNEICNWQDTTTRFINILTEKFSSYLDIIQPIQVAIYEMKLGLSLVLSDSLEKDYLKKIEEPSSARILKIVLSLVRFPRVLPEEAGLINFDMIPTDSAPGNVTNALAMDMCLLNRLFSVSNGSNQGKMVSTVQLQASVYHLTLFLLVCSLKSSLVFHCNSFMLMHEIFSYFANMWMGMKDQVKAKEDSESHGFKFKPRSFMIEDILKVDPDPSIFHDIDVDGNIASDSMNMSIEQDSAVVTGPNEGSESFDNLEEEWNDIQDSILKDVVVFHDQIFGSSNLHERCGNIEVTDKDRLHFFSDSYKLGMKVIKCLPAIISSKIEETLVPEHLLQACLEYGVAQNTPQHSYNVYKDSNASELSKMVKPLMALQQQCALEKWTDHPGLQRIVDLTKDLLAMPFTTPLSQALLGIQFLLNRTFSLQENNPKFKLKDMLPPILSIVKSWQKIELECWPSLLDGVRQHHETSAAKLWFALSSVLQRDISDDHHIENILTIESLEEFIHSSSIGEFDKRLQLLLAFYGQFNTGRRLNAPASGQLQDNLKILYNVFGYYIQFLPLVLEHIETGRQEIEKEMIKLLKLSKWDDNQFSYLSIESFRKTRQKSLKLIKKYNDLLQKPVMIILNDQASLKKNKYSTWLEDESPADTDKGPFQAPIDIIQYNTNRYLWYTEWKRIVKSAIKICGKADFLHSKELSSDLKKSLLPMLEFESFQTGWEVGWISLENIWQEMAGFASIWKRGLKNLKERRGLRRELANLLKNLKENGLSQHRSLISSEVEFDANKPCTSFLQPSYDVEHLLLIEDNSYSNMDSGNHILEWQLANQCYFKNLAMRQQLRQISLNFHKDLTVEQVYPATSFLDHLILIQQDQRTVIYSFSEKLKSLKKLLISTECIGSDENCLIHNQQTFIECMWAQKNIFDSLLSLSGDVLLFLRSVQNSHINNCSAAKAEGDLYTFIHEFIQRFQQSKKSLDRYLLGTDGIVSLSSESMLEIFISKEMMQFVMQNFQVINEFDEGIHAFCLPEASWRSLEIFINRFKELTTKALVSKKKLDGKSCEKDSLIDCVNYMQNFNKHDVAYSQAFDETDELLTAVLGNMHFLCQGQNLHDFSEIEKITSWKVVFESYIGKLHMDRIHNTVIKMIVAGKELLKHSDHSKTEVSSRIDMGLKAIHVSIDILCSFGDGILSELLTLHRMVSEVSYMLSNIFCSLFSKGFGEAEEPLDENGKLQDASGTGLGEGEGLNDVSDQIEDEGQILGDNDKNENLEKSEKVGSKDEKGIEMDEDFTAETFSVSEDSDSDECDEEEEDMNIDSLMGENEKDSQAVQEKLCDKNEGDPSDSNEKYESGSSVKEKDSSSRELRAKDDKDTSMDDSTQFDDDDDDEKDALKEDDNECCPDDKGMSDDVMDQSDAFEDSTGIDIPKEIEAVDASENPQSTAEEMEEECDDGDGDGDDAISDEHLGSCPDNDAETEDDKTDENIENEGNSCPIDDNVDGIDFKEVGDDDTQNESKMENKSKSSMESMGINEELGDHEMMDSTHDHPMQDPNKADQKNDPHAEKSANLTSLNQHIGNETCVGPSSGLPSEDDPKVGQALPDSNGNSRLDGGQIQPQSDNYSVEIIQPNPYRSIGDALKDWKESVKISSDSQELGTEAPENVNDEIANEYQFVSNTENATSQALGPATSDQIKNDLKTMDHETEGKDIKKKKDVDMLDVLKENTEIHHARSLQASSSGNHQSEKLVESSMDCVDADMEESDENIEAGQLGNWVSFQRELQNDEYLESCNHPSGSNNDLLKTVELETIPDCVKERAISDWRHYEHSTTKLSHELAEQLRLVMEPTLASRLQGDYKTGKKINMKKIIPYIASNYKKDKIWLRRTKPNKRNYQVVIAVDDSRSMSESRCGSFAMEALVTVCRAMSQLEVGQLAVTSFGEIGNIKLLHDFDQPFGGGEAGVKMISSFSFKQDNTIENEPMTDLLAYLNNMLDSAVSKARLPSGNNPLQQLILIISDGHFSEKEKLKTRVRNLLSSGKRMIAYILLDNLQESIMDLPEVSFQGEKLTVKKYMNDFPFPYYVVLREIEALPRTLADLLRQWFELQSSFNE